LKKIVVVTKTEKTQVAMHPTDTNILRINEEIFEAKHNFLTAFNNDRGELIISDVTVKPSGLRDKISSKEITYQIPKTVAVFRDWAYWKKLE